MHITIAHIFNKVARPLAVLATGLVIASAPLFAKETRNKGNAFSKPTYWSYDNYSLIFKVEKCAERGLCISINNLDPQNPIAKSAYKWIYGSSKNKAEITRYDLLNLCGYQLDNKTEEIATDIWDGSIHLKTPYGDRDGGLALKLKDHNTLRMTGSYFISISKLLQRVEKPSPECFFTPAKQMKPN